MSGKVEIIEIKEAAAETVAAINVLLSQLTSTPVDITPEVLLSIVNSPCTHLYAAVCDGKMCGMLTLAHYQAPTGRKLWVEDVVVDTSMRGRSIGRLLVEHAIEKAKEIGGTLMLTSKPARVAANALYRSAGFQAKETNVYKMDV